MKRLTILLALLVPFNIYAAPPKTFAQAKKQARILFAFQRETLYCKCKFDSRLKVDLASCNMQSASRFKRARVVEYEHMMPAENFGAHFQCWREPLCIKKNGKRYKGRKCCEKMDKQFRQAEGELYNLWPAVGLINGARSNFRFDKLEKQSLFYGCPITIDKKARRVEPADFAKGIVARANLFMAYKYGIKLSQAQCTLFTLWDKQFPPTTNEKWWVEAVEKIEGYPNPYIKNHH